MRIRGFGRSALLVEVTSASQAAALAVWARSTVAEAAIEVAEIVPAARTVLFDGVVEPERLRARLAEWSVGGTSVRGRLVELPTAYDGPDLAFVARLWGVPEDEVVRRHTSIEMTSAFCGFAPGFAYLTGMPAEWAVPRRESPRPRVPVGSVALAGEYCGVYPGASPGGWQLVGRTDATLWDLSRDEPALLAPGTRVRFVAA